MQPMSCDECERMLAMLVGGDLDPTDRARVAHHCESCSACAVKAADFETIRGDLQALGRFCEGMEPPFVFAPNGDDIRPRPVPRIIRLTRAALPAAALIGLAFLTHQWLAPQRAADVPEIDVP